jgi:hypothetical protein
MRAGATKGTGEKGKRARKEKGKKKKEKEEKGHAKKKKKRKKGRDSFSKSCVPFFPPFFPDLKSTD